MSDELRGATDRGADARQIVLSALAADASPRRAARVLAALLKAPYGPAHALMRHFPSALPHVLSPHEAERWRAELVSAGFGVELAQPGEPRRCHVHVQHWRSTDCSGCRQPLCALCAVRSPDAMCAACASRKARQRRCYRIRVSFLLSILALVIAYGVIDHARRGARRAWERPLHIALVLIEQRGPLEPELLERFEQRLPALEAALATEFSRYGGAFTPIRFQRFGTIPAMSAPPRATGEIALLEPIFFSLALLRFARQHDAASGLSSDHYDGKIYVLLSSPSEQRRALVEGAGQDGGRLAVAQLELSDDSIDFGLFVIAHELMHLLGATDRYGPDGRTFIPDGLAEPELEPLYPQRAAEVMARGRVLSPGHEVPLHDLRELRVGPQTAGEIGWLSARTQK